MKLVGPVLVPKEEGRRLGSTDDDDDDDDDGGSNIVLICGFLFDAEVWTFTMVLRFANHDTQRVVDGWWFQDMEVYARIQQAPGV